MKTIQNGAATYSWEQREEILDPYSEPGTMFCRIDLNFMRPGRDFPMPVEAGVAPDRQGVLFCDFTEHLHAQDRIQALSGPVEGIFEIRAIPDIAVGYSDAHHLEVAITEVSQILNAGRTQFPGK